MARTVALMSLLLLAAGRLAGLELVIPRVLPPPGPAERPANFDNPELPGRGEPDTPPPAAIYVVIWGDGNEHRSYLVVPPGRETVRTATVFTMFDEGGPFSRYRVSYHGRVFTDADGVVQFDCRRQAISGPEADSWSPDSFSVGPRGTIGIIDDAMRRSAGRLERVIRPGERSDETDLGYRVLRRIVQARITGML